MNRPLCASYPRDRRKAERPCHTAAGGGAYYVIFEGGSRRKRYDMEVACSADAVARACEFADDYFDNYVYPVPPERRGAELRLRFYAAHAGSPGILVEDMCRDMPREVKA